MAKAPSLAAQSGALSTDLKLPDSFQAPAEPILMRALAPYIVFCHPNRKDEWKKLTDKFGGSVTDGEMYLIEGDRLTHLPVAKLGYVAGQQYWVSANAAGEVQQTAFKEMPHPFKEHVEAIVIAYFEDRAVLANMQFRTTKCPAAGILNAALLAASGKHKEGDTPWAELSQAHKETLICTYAWQRFYGEVTVAPARPSKSGPGAGMLYRTTQCTIKPTGIPEWRLIEALSKSKDAQKAFDDADRRLKGRIAEMRMKEVKS